MVNPLALAAALALPAVSMAAAVPTEDLSSDRIIGGQPARPGQFPATLNILRHGRHYCGATLVGRHLAVTAAHCLDEGYSGMSVRAGSIYPTSGGVESRVRSVRQHPNYRAHLKNHDFDIALLYLQDPIDAGGNIAYALLPSQGSDPSGRGTAVGWGHTAWQGQNSDVLRHVTVPITNRQTCRAKHSSLGLEITNNMVCAGGRGKDACQNDSGGPFYQTGSNTLIGVVSFGEKCATEYGGVYARVSNFVDWIKQNA
ncbi:hypothetical protein LOZ52_006704 [Ophidiomyces ophidiicola]|nr:hypothetical protein LOZ29_002038 [Ophidiomyces ophidiicola]KAI2420501.1 hypothetical protein LOZ52_006704 [Ophidiomyces ophidiicola]KAI2444832.1 hypothetical protein LOZ08_001852 [Ophidiomyces ophidiicola]KAI2450795.1 hypothetical protein LOY86_004693 [Ophidiomyces ophidiicola]